MHHRPRLNWKIALLIFAASVILPARSVLAQTDGFGLGIIVGEPTGISAKKWMSATTALDFAAAWSLTGDNSFSLHADYLSHKFDLFNPDAGRLPFYYGIGGRLRLGDKDDELGVRIPLGLNYHFSDITLDLFLELVPILDLAPDTDFEINAALGVRYFFK